MKPIPNRLIKTEAIDINQVREVYEIAGELITGTILYIINEFNGVLRYSYAVGVYPDPDRTDVFSVYGKGSTWKECVADYIKRLEERLPPIP